MAVVPSTAAGTSKAHTQSYYPRAGLSQQEVTADPKIFAQALKQLHEEMGTQYRVPQVAGKELDLFLLYKQVTNLGGLEAVITGKKWGEVAVPFQFPASFTSKSFTLRKMYSKLLYDFEQVYLHRNAGPPPFPPGKDVGIKVEPGTGLSSEAAKRRRVDAVEGEGVGHMAGPPALAAFHHGPPISANTSLVGKALTGRVDAKFDYGYFVSVDVDSHAFQGALYVPPSGPTPVRPSAAAEVSFPPQNVHAQGNESNSPADETIPEPSEAYQADVAAGRVSMPLQRLPPQLWQRVGQPPSQQALAQLAHVAPGFHDSGARHQQAAQAASGRHQEWKALWAQNWDAATTPVQRQAAATDATAQVDDTGRPGSSRQEGSSRQADAHQDEPDNTYSTQEVAAQRPMSPAYQLSSRQHREPLALHAGQQHDEDRQGMSQEGLATAINLFHGQRQHFGQQQQQQQQQQQFLEAMQHSSLSHPQLTSSMDEASLQRLLHRADEGAASSTQHLALPQPLQPHLPRRIVSGQPFPRIRPPSPMPVPPLPWLAQPRAEQHFSDGPLNLAGSATGNLPFPYAPDSFQHQLATTFGTNSDSFTGTRQQTCEGSQDNA